MSILLVMPYGYPEHSHSYYTTSQPQFQPKNCKNFVFLCKTYDWRQKKAVLHQVQPILICPLQQISISYTEVQFRIKSRSKL